MIRRQFVRIGDRHVHYRYAGQGPALLLLHQSPQNSRMWLSMIERFAGRYTVIAPDTPGFGYSDPLPGEPGIDDFARATLEFADALGLQKFALFGMHTGGLIGMHTGWIAPQRLSALIVDGYALFNDAERARYTGKYLPPFEPSWDGGHLRWLWSRMREQLYFFPWCDPSADCAIVLPPYTAAGTHEAAMDILDVGDNYRIGYGAAFRYTERQRVGELQCPSWLVYRTSDVLLPHRQRLPELPQKVVSVVEPDDVEGLHRRMDAILAETTDVLGDATAQFDATVGAGWYRQIVATAVGEVAVWGRGGNEGAVLHIHAPGEHPLQPADVSADERTQLLIELPGHGASCETSHAPTAATMQTALLAVCQQLAGNHAVEVQAHDGAVAYVPALVAALSGQVNAVVLHRPWLLNAGECDTFLQQLPDPTIHPAGGHMAWAWQWERERHLLWPWLPHSAAARRAVAGPPTAQVHANVVELLRLGQQLRTLFADVAVPGMADAIVGMGVPVRVQVAEVDDYDGRAAALQQRLSA
jgi:pimeloyl-ACP methyl ester carboxylesterase